MAAPICVLPCIDTLGYVNEQSTASVEPSEVGFRLSSSKMTRLPPAGYGKTTRSLSSGFDCRVRSKARFPEGGGYLLGSDARRSRSSRAKPASKES